MSRLRIAGAPRLALALAAAGVALGLGLVLSWRQSGGTPSPQVLHLLASDELDDTRGLLTEFTRRTGTVVQVRYAPTAEILRTLAGPAGAFGGRYDAVWIADDRTRAEPPAVDDRLESGTTIMSSPLVLGLRSGTPPEALTAGRWRNEKFEFAMVAAGTAEANASLLTVAGDLAEAPEALSPQEVYRIAPRLRALSERQVVSGRDHRELTEQFLRSGRASAVLTLESEILRLGAAGTSPTLRPFAPGGRAVMTEYRLRPVLPPFDRPGRADPRRLTRFLTEVPAQSWLVRHTHRRPGSLEPVPGAEAFPPVHPVAVPRFPGLLDQLSGIYRGTYHYPTRTIFVLDTSGSMRGAGMRALRAAFRSLGPSFVTRDEREAEVLVIPFSSRPGDTRSVDVSTDAPDEGLRALTRVVDRLDAGGGTALYAALEQADREVADRLADGNEAVTSIVLVTDGANTEGPGLPAYERHRAWFEKEHCTSRNELMCRVPVHPVLTGRAQEAQMRALARATGGRVHDARAVDLGRILQKAAAGR